MQRRRAAWFLRGAFGLPGSGRNLVFYSIQRQLQFRLQLGAEHGADRHRLLWPFNYHQPDVLVSTAGGWTFNAGRLGLYLQQRGPSPFGLLSFTGAGIVSNGGIAAIINNVVQFNNTSTAGSAAIIKRLRHMVFNNTSTAGNAAITIQAPSSDTSTAGSANIDTLTNGLTAFVDSSTAGNASITAQSGGNIVFSSSASAGTATLIANTGGSIFFQDAASGGTARFVTTAGGVVSIAGLTSSGTTAGSI